jgi:hypothetical protein
MVLLASIVAGCGPSQPPYDRYGVGDFTIVVPSGWTVHEEPDADGFNIVEPPSGQGRLLLLELHAKQSREIDAEYALEQARREIEALGLPTTGLTPRQVGDSHYVTTVEGVSGGEHVVASVHVLASADIVFGFFHTPDEADPMRDAARHILESVTPRTP